MSTLVQPPLKSPADHRLDVLEKQVRVYRKLLDRAGGQTRFACNLCGYYGPFQNFGTRNRPNARCPVCAGLERSRLLVKALERVRPTGPGDRVLELAPFKGTCDYFRYTLGADFIGIDIDAEKMIRRDIPCLRADLCADTLGVTERFDVIVNSHVMEHLPCDPYAVIGRLSALLRPGGAHLISVPFGGRRDVEDLSPDLTEADRRRRFAHPEHYRAFGHEEFPERLRAMFGERFAEFDRSVFAGAENDRHALGLDLPANRLFVIRGPATGSA